MKGSTFTFYSLFIIIVKKINVRKRDYQQGTENQEHITYAISVYSG